LNDPLDAEEQRIRAVLRLPASASSAPQAARPGRHRFVRDGEVPVTVVNPRHAHPAPDRDAIAGLERALAAERQGREAAEKALEQARELIHQLQTRLAHAEFARAEIARAEIARQEAAPPPADQAPLPELAEPAEDEAVDWWTPGWRDRFRARQQDAGPQNRGGRPPQP
jgi:hypothetical protein